MKTGQHTEGPWRLGSNGDECGKDHAICAGTLVIAKVYGRGYPIGSGWSQQSQADAWLIAAAPSLLAALDALLPFAEDELASLHSCLGRDGDDLMEEVDACEAAIKRARAAVARAEEERAS